MYGINGSQYAMIAPHSTVSAQYEDFGTVAVELVPAYESFIRKKWYGTEYQVSLKSKYTFQTPANGMELQILQRKDDVVPSVHYEYLLLQTAECTHIGFPEHQLSGRENFEKEIKRRKKRNIISKIILFLIEPIVLSPIFFSIYTLLGIMLSHWFGTKILFIYFPAYYLIHYLCNLIGGILGNIVFGREKKEKLAQYFNDEYINDYCIKRMEGPKK